MSEERLILITSGEYSDYRWIVATREPKEKVMAAIRERKARERKYHLAVREIDEAVGSIGVAYTQAQWEQVKTLRAERGAAEYPCLEKTLRELLSVVEVEEINADDVPAQ